MSRGLFFLSFHAYSSGYWGVVPGRVLLPLWYALYVRMVHNKL